MHIHKTLETKLFEAKSKANSSFVKTKQNKNPFTHLHEKSNGHSLMIKRMGKRYATDVNSKPVYP